MISARKDSVAACAYSCALSRIEELCRQLQCPYVRVVIIGRRGYIMVYHLVGLEHTSVYFHICAIEILYYEHVHVTGHKRRRHGLGGATEGIDGHSRSDCRMRYTAVCGRRTDRVVHMTAHTAVPFQRAAYRPMGIVEKPDNQVVRTAVGRWQQHGIGVDYTERSLRPVGVKIPFDRHRHHIVSPDAFHPHGGRNLLDSAYGVKTHTQRNRTAVDSGRYS